MMAVPTGVVLLLEGFIGEVCLLRCEFMWSPGENVGSLERATATPYVPPFWKCGLWSTWPSWCCRCVAVVQGCLTVEGGGWSDSGSKRWMCAEAAALGGLEASTPWRLHGVWSWPGKAWVVCWCCEGSGLLARSSQSKDQFDVALWSAVSRHASSVLQNVYVTRDVVACLQARDVGAVTPDMVVCLVRRWSSIVWTMRLRCFCNFSAQFSS
jgi:hypothetical protein